MLTLAGLAEYLDGVWHGNANHAIFSFCSLVRATATDVACFENPLALPLLQTTHAGAVLLKPEFKDLFHGNRIVVNNPIAAIKQVSSLLQPVDRPYQGIHHSVQIDDSAYIGEAVTIGPYSIIGPQTVLGKGVTIGSNTIVESAVSIGEKSVIGSGVVLHSSTRIGCKVAINSGCIIGASPFNYLKEHGTWKQGIAVGSVVIGDRVHIGANTVIDQGTLEDTYIGEGVCIDNLVQIAHDVVIGKHSAIAGCAAIGAQVIIGSDCIIGGASSIAADVNLVDDVVITGMSTVTKSINKPGIYSSGTLIHEHHRWRRNAARFRRLDDYISRLNALERQITNEN